MQFPARVLIVDRSLDSREVLRTLLARCGAETVEASSPSQGVEVFERERPDLIVLDVENAAHAGRCGIGTSTPCGRLAAAAAGADTPIVVLGTLSRGIVPNGANSGLAKPYHYGQLVRKIEELLGNSA